MKTNKLIYLLLLLGCYSNSFAQLAILRDNGTGNPILANPYSEVKGSPYIDDFREGVLLLNNGQTVSGLQIALQGYEHTLQYKLDGNLFAYTPENLSGFTYISDSGEAMEYTSEFTVPTKGERQFMRVLEKGKYMLLSYPYKIMVDDPNATYGTQASKVFQNQENIIVVKDGESFLFKNKSKDLQKIFGDDYEKIPEIEKSLKLNLKKTHDIRLLIRALNQ